MCCHRCRNHRRHHRPNTHIANFTFIVAVAVVVAVVVVVVVAAVVVVIVECTCLTRAKVRVSLSYRNNIVFVGTRGSFLRALIDFEANVKAEMKLTCLY